jgi:DNA polymerase-1
MRNTYVPPYGSQDSALLFCGEQPGKQEVFQGRPFIGPAGKELDDCCRIAGIDFNQTYKTNVIKDLDKPINQYINLSSKLNSTSDEAWEYIKELQYELQTVSPKVVVAVGGVALFALTSRTGINKWRGSILDCTLVTGLKVIPIIHPATVIRPKFQYLNKYLICYDLNKAKKVAEGEIKSVNYNLITNPSFRQSIDTIRMCHEYPIIDWDIEVINEELDCFSLAWTPTDAISIPLREVREGHYCDYFTIDQETQVILELAKLLENDKVTKAGANNIFDQMFMLHKYGIRTRNPSHTHDTQIAQKISMPDYKAGLDFVTSIHTNIPYYKADGKKWMKLGAGSIKEWWTYSAMDAISTASARLSQLETLSKQNNLHLYEETCKLIEPLLYMQERGIRVNVQGILKQHDEDEVKLDKLKEKLNEVVGHSINHNSPKQLIDYFYGEKGLKPYKKRNTKGKYVPTTDVDAMKRLARRGFKEAKIILDMRSFSKRLGTYLDVKKIDKDGRYRSSYNPVGAQTGRLSSSETIFGTGGNQQNWPHDLLRFFQFDEGYIGYSIDLAQAENRLVAYFGNILSMIQAFESGQDLHRLTAALVFNKSPDQISDEDGSSLLGDGRQSERFWGKKCNHSANYDFGYKSFALKYEVTESEAKWILERYHSSYPGVRGSYHRMVQDMLRTDRTITNPFGRSRIFMGPIVPSYPNITKHMCTQTFKEAYAHLPQSTVADIIRRTILYIWNNQSLFAPVEILTQVHDSIVFQIPTSIPMQQHVDILNLIKAKLEEPFEWHSRRISIPADISVGLNLYKKQMVEFKSKDNLSEETLIEAYTNVKRACSA